MPARLRLIPRATLALLFLALAACASTGTRVDADLPAFTNGVNAILKAGMPVKEARSAVRTRFPDPDSDIESAPLVATRGQPVQVRRFMMVWSTTEPGTQYVLTLECDSEMRVARWSVGPLYTNGH
ncbi:MAG: hypothetical protein IAE82_14745 [Opitutaceae bacterium]|nr:hypothetical protein [Opitutaceae bacterium]